MNAAKLINEAVSKGRSIPPAERTPFFTLEFFPPNTQPGMRNLLDRIYRLGQFNPLCVDVTWQGSSVKSRESSIDLCDAAQKYCGVVGQLHISCTSATKDELRKYLQRAKEAGITSLFALRGDPPVGQDIWTRVEGGFEHASELVAFIRCEFGSYFSIAGRHCCSASLGSSSSHRGATCRKDGRPRCVVGGYCDGHPESADYMTSLLHLKQKV
jgi:methylenetetrahydrofolate reductase (NADPH)